MQPTSSSAPCLSPRLSPRLSPHSSAHSTTPRPRPILPAPPPLILNPAHHPAQRHGADHLPGRRGQEPSVGERLRQARNTVGPYVLPARPTLPIVAARPITDGNDTIKSALSLLENGLGLANIPEAHRTQRVAYAFVAITGASVQEVEQQSCRIGRALRSRGLPDEKIAALVIENIRLSHYRLGHGTMTMTQLATKVINYATRKMLCDLYEVRRPHTTDLTLRPAIIPPSVQVPPRR